VTVKSGLAGAKSGEPLEGLGRIARIPPQPAWNGFRQGGLWIRRL